jgi:hypothetical protein
LIQTASIAAYRGGQAYMVHYAASKAGVVSITRTAAQVLATDSGPFPLVAARDARLFAPCFPWPRHQKSLCQHLACADDVCTMSSLGRRNLRA